MDKTEIVFISNFLGNGGAARVITVLAEAFFMKGYKVTVCSFPFSDGYEYKLIEGIDHIKFTLKSKNIFLRKLERIICIREFIKIHKNSTIIAFEYFVNMQTIVACLGLRNRVIVSERNDPKRVGGNFPTYMIRNILYRFADKLVCQTSDAKEYFPNYIRRKAVVIPNPIKDKLPEPWTGEREKYIVNFCRLQKQKNLPLLLDAFSEFNKEFPEYKLKIFGDGEENEPLKQYVLDNGYGNIEINSAITDIHEKVMSAEMFVSTSDYEGLSNSMIEAMAIGIPTICTDCPVGGAKMMIENGLNGILVPVGNKPEIVKAMKRIATDTKFANSLSIEGSKVREKLSVDNIVENWEELL